MSINASEVLNKELLLSMFYGYLGSPTFRLINFDNKSEIKY